MQEGAGRLPMAFFAINDYSSMLNRIGWATFGVWILAIFTLNQRFEPIQRLLPQLNVKVPNTEFQVPAGVLLVAAVVAGLCRAFKLHDRLSDLLGIRRSFDVKEILLPLASASGATLSLNQQSAVEAKRRALMGQVFYKYVSSTLNEPAIDRHNIFMALDQWSWYWIVLEAAAIAIATAIVASYFGDFALGFWLLAGVLAASWLTKLLRERSVRYAHDQIRMILEDPTRKNEVSMVFSALPS
jgi:hypothetical protein